MQQDEVLTFEYSSANPAMPVAYGSFAAMHTVCEVLLPGLAREASERLVERVGQSVSALEAKFNRFDPQSPVSRINRTGGGVDITVDDDLYGALEMCRLFRRATAGCFDIAVQSSPRPPGEAFTLVPQRHAIRLAADGVVLDFGGFAKGYALERVKQLLARERIERAVVNFGNSSVLAVGAHPYGDGWPVGVADPWRSGEQAHAFLLCDRALSVSGHTPEHPQHIVSPVEGGYTRREGFVAVEGRSPLVAEVLSTALFAAPQRLWPEIMENYAEYRAVRIECRGDGPAIVSEIV